MSTPSPAGQSHYHLMLLHPTEPRILLLPAQHGWFLPSFHKEEPTHLSEIIDAMQRQLGVDAIVLYCASQHVDREHACKEIIYVLELRHPSWIPPRGTRWVGQDTLAHLELTLPEQRTVMATCLHEAEEIPPLRPPWARRGWFAETESWIKTQLARLNSTIIAPIEQVRSWGISCVLRVPTTHGNVYFKAIPTSCMLKNSPIPSSENSERLPLFFTHEPILIQSLAAWYPQNMPTVLAVERERCWMLLAEFGTELYAHPDQTAWEKALEVYGHMQVAAAQRIDTFLAAGCLDRRLHILETQIDPLLDDEDILADLSSSQIMQLRAQRPYLKTMCHHLGNYAIPQTLVHGDLHTGNIAVHNDTYIYFDWTDSCIAHPFFDALPFLDNVDDPARQQRLRDNYLALWTDYASRECLQEIFPLSQTLATIHQAVSYQHIMANVEGISKQEMRGGATYWLRKLLQLLAETDERVAPDG